MATRTGYDHTKQHRSSKFMDLPETLRPPITSSLSPLYYNPGGVSMEQPFNLGVLNQAH